MRMTLTKAALTICAITSLLCAGCIGPHYRNDQIIVSGKPAPRIRGPRDPAIAANLTTNLWAKSPLPDRSAEIVVTIAKSAGIQGWKDYHLRARASGIVMQHEFSSNGFLTIDLLLKSLKVRRTYVPLRGTRYIRVECFLGDLSVNKNVYDSTNALVIAQGKFVWDSDGWFEIHPKKTGDVVLAPPAKPVSSRWPVVP